MQHNSTGPMVFPATDPESNRMVPEDVLAIHRAHLAGVGWDEIARQHDTTRRQVSRIVQGRRWGHLHPAAHPELYEHAGPTAAPEMPESPQPDRTLEIVNKALQDARDKILKELRQA